MKLMPSCSHGPGAPAADGEKAVFAIPSFGDQSTEYGFVTQDAGLIQALLSVWSRYIEAAKRVSSAPALVKVS